MEHRKSPIDNENKRRQKSAEKPSDALPSERLQKSRSSHLIGSGKNPYEMSNQQISLNETSPSKVDRQSETHHDIQDSLKHDADKDPSQAEKKLAERETREKQAITTPSDGDLDHLSTQDRNEKRQLSALEEALEEVWLKSIPLNEYGHRAPKIIELTDVPTCNKLILVGGMKGWMEGMRKGIMKITSREKSELSHCRPEVPEIPLGDRSPLDTPRSTDLDVTNRNLEDEACEWINQTLGNYKLVEYLRYDSTSWIYRGEHVDSNKPVTVVVLKKMHKKIPESVNLFCNEAKKIKNLRHPYIVHGLESDETIHYWVMENAPKRRLCDAYPQGTRLSLGKVVAMVNDLTDALLYLHYDKKMKHLNITPKTVLLGPYDLPVLSGFKLAQEVDSPSSAKGRSEEYSSPEVYSVSGKPDTRSDPYSAAVMVYELLTGQHPFSGEQPEPETKPEPLVGKIDGISEKVQKNIQKVLFKALAYDPNDRYKNVKIFAEELEKACFGRIRRPRPPRERLQKLYQEIAQHDEVISLNSKDVVSAHFNKGLVLSELGHDEEAVNAYLEAMKLEPNNAASVYYQLGNAYYNLGHHSEAVAAFNETIERLKLQGTLLDNEVCVEAYYHMGKALAELGQHKAAVEAYKKAIKLKSEHVGAHFNKGIAHAEDGDYQEAVNAFEDTIKRIDQEGSTLLYNTDICVEAHYRMGKAFSELGQHKKAVEAYKEAIKLDREEHVGAHFNKGVALAADGNYQGAVKAFKDTIRLFDPAGPRPVTELISNEEATRLNQKYQEHPEYVEAHYHMGNALYKLGDHRKAVEAYDVAIHFNPEHADAIAQRENALRDLKRNEVEIAPNASRPQPSSVEVQRDIPGTSGTDNANENLEVPESSDSNGTDDLKQARAHYRNGLAFARQGDYQGAVNAFSEAINLNPGHAGTYYQRGNAYSKLGDLGDLGSYDKAVADYKSAIHLNPNHADAYDHMGYAYSKLNKPKEAEEAYDKCIEIKQSAVAEAHYQKGLALRERRDNQGAEEAFEMATRLNPKHRDACRQLVLVRYDQGKVKEAEEANDKLASIIMSEQQQ